MLATLEIYKHLVNGYNDLEDFSLNLDRRVKHGGTVSARHSLDKKEKVDLSVDMVRNHLDVLGGEVLQ